MLAGGGRCSFREGGNNSGPVLRSTGKCRRLVLRPGLGFCGDVCSECQMKKCIWDCSCLISGGSKQCTSELGHQSLGWWLPIKYGCWQVKDVSMTSHMCIGSKFCSCLGHANLSLSPWHLSSKDPGCSMIRNAEGALPGCQSLPVTRYKISSVLALVLLMQSPHLEE